MDTIPLPFPPVSPGAAVQDIVIREGAPALDALFPGGNALAVTDSTVARLPAAAAFLRARGAFVLPAGEAHKTLSAVESIIEAALLRGVTRAGVFAAIGGGVVSDLTGFAAAVFMRGAAWEAVPTTLLGMVDAAVGGKTGCDISGHKNTAGAFYPARRVHIFPEFTRSLPEAEYRSGLAEAFKTALLFDESLYRFFRDGRGQIERRESAALFRVVRACACAKAAVVREDFTERGRRALLNLGHTFGHALEASAGLGRLSHGEAVAWGMARACELGEALGMTPPERAARIRGVLDEFGYETGVPYPGAPVEAMIAAMAADKKARGGAPVFVVPDAESARVVSGFPGGMDLVRRILGERS